MSFHTCGNKVLNIDRVKYTEKKNDAKKKMQTIIMPPLTGYPIKIDGQLLCRQ